MSISCDKKTVVLTFWQESSITSRDMPGICDANFKIHKYYKMLALGSRRTGHTDLALYLLSSRAEECASNGKHSHDRKSGRRIGAIPIPYSSRPWK